MLCINIHSQAGYRSFKFSANSLLAEKQRLHTLFLCWWTTSSRLAGWIPEISYHQGCNASHWQSRSCRVGAAQQPIANVISSQYCTPTIQQEDQGQYVLGQLWASVAKCLRLVLSAQPSGAKHYSALKSLFASQFPWCIILHSPMEH